MSKRKTKCLTWGQERTRGETWQVNDSRVRLCLVDHVTLCGREDPACTVPDLWSPSEPRPKGVCPECWKQYRNDMLADMYCCPPADTTKEEP